MAPAANFIRQVGVIPVRDGLVCLVRSSSGRRWVAPKGCLEPGKTAGEMALLEAWEEAGLVGRLSADPVGSYLYQKFGNQYHVTVFALDVREAAAEYPERGVRERIWVSPEHAVSLVEERGLQELIRGVTGERRDLSA